MILPYLFILSSIFLWMLYPPLSNTVLNTVSVDQSAFLMHGTAAFFITVIAIFYLKRDTLYVLKNLNTKLFSYIILSGFLIFSSHILLFKALSLSNEYDILSIIIFESWPIFTFILNNKIRLKKKSNLIEYSLIFLSFFGFILLMLPSLNNNITEINEKFLIVSVYSLLGALSMSLNCLSRVIIINRVGSIDGIKLSSLKLGIITEFFVRIISVVFFAGLLTFKGQEIIVSNIELETLGVIIFIGIFILIIGSILYDLAIYKSNTSNLIVLWYIIPIGSIMYFILFDNIYPTFLETLACLCIISSNILLNSYKKIIKRIKIWV